MSYTDTLAEKKDQEELIIKPELPIGTEFWLMIKNRAVLGLVAAYEVRVTSCVENDSWYDQLWIRWSRKKHKEVWKYSYTYCAKLDGWLESWPMTKTKRGWELNDRKVYWSKEELMKDL